MNQTLLQRIRPILMAIFAAALSHNLFFVMLPIQLVENGQSSSSIGAAMGMFAAGAILAGLVGSAAVIRVGHVRAFASMAAMLAIVAVIHSYTSNIWFTAALRIVAGFCFVTSFITLESWLNVLSDKTNRARIFSIYQICFAVGFGLAPFLLTFSDSHDPRLFGVISLFLCSSLIIMAMSRLPQPAPPAKAMAMGLKRLWRYSPSGTLSCFCAGIINSTSISLISLYAYERGFDGLWLALILGSYQAGGLLTQYPVGWFADRYDKRTVAAGLMVLGLISNGLIILEYFVGMPIEWLVLLFLISGGAGVALFPLAVTQVFDHIEEQEAMPATSTMQVLLGVGGVLGPIVAGFLMSQFGSIWLYYFLIAIHLFVAVFLVVRRFVIRTEQLPQTTSYKVTTQPVSAGGSELDPRVSYDLAGLSSPELQLLIAALAQQPKDPKQLLETTFSASKLKIEDAASHLVLALPKQSGVLMANLVELYPERRLSLAQSLIDLFELDKKRINYALAEGLCQGAADHEKQKIWAMVQSVPAPP